MIKMSESKQERKERERKEKEEQDKLKNGESLTGNGKTLITGKAGRVKKTDEEFTEAYNTYISRMEKRNTVIEKDEEKLKILDREAWNKSKPSGETSHEIFVRLTKSRMPSILSKFDNISNLSKYEHDDKQAEKIVNDLLSAVEKVKMAFSAKSENKEIEDYQI
jgi:hypothetical protein